MSFTFPNDLADYNFANPTKLDENFAAGETLMDGGIKDEHVDPDAAIDARKIGNGGAVTTGETTLVGAANKIPKFDASGNLVITRIVFKEA